MGRTSIECANADCAGIVVGAVVAVVVAGMLAWLWRRQVAQVCINALSLCPGCCLDMNRILCCRLSIVIACVIACAWAAGTRPVHHASAEAGQCTCAGKAGGSSVL